MNRWFWIICLLLVLRRSSVAQDTASSISLVEIASFQITSETGIEALHVQWSPDNRRIAVNASTKSGDAQVPSRNLSWIFDLEGDSAGYEIPPFRDWYAGSARFIAQPKDGDAQMFDAATGHLLFDLSGIQSFPQLSPDQAMVAGSGNDNTLSVYDAAAGNLLLRLDDQQPNRFSWHPASRHLVSLGTDDTLRFYHVLTGEVLDTLSGYRGSNSWSPDGTRLVVSPIGDYYLINPHAIWTPGQGVSAIFYNNTGGSSWSADSREFAAVSDFTKVRFYDAASGELLRTVRPFDEPPIEIWQPIYDSHSLVLRAGDNRRIPFILILYDFIPERRLVEFPMDVWHFIVIEGERLMLVQPLYGLREFDRNSGEALFEIDYEDVFPVGNPSLDYNFGVSIYAFEGEAQPPGTVELYGLRDGQLKTRIRAHPGELRQVVWSPDSRHFAILTQDNTIRVFEIRQ